MRRFKFSHQAEALYALAMQNKQFVWFCKLGLYIAYSLSLVDNLVKCRFLQKERKQFLFCKKLA